MKPALFIPFAMWVSAQTCHGAVDFAREIRPILNAHCVACHGGVKEAGEVSFIYRDKALGHGESGKPVIVPGDPSASEMMVRILSKDPAEVMPKPAHGPALLPAEVAVLQQWIREGAPWKEHWSFVSPVIHQAPQVQNPGWARQELDQFILARLEKEHLQPADEASPAALLRRVSLDLTGLPPTLNELDAFLANPSADAYQDQVERLLKSPHFGERWASVWMDLARYADSEGLGLDRRRDVWKYRDWLIHALNADMPFDQFTLEQLAGDLLPQATLDQHIATAFHRLTQANNEGGTDDEEFRVSAVMDRVATTWEVWQGLTMGCVQCHAHPYDPIEHQEYYRFMAFFNNTADADIEEGLPTIPVPLSPGRHAESGRLQDRIRDLEERYFRRHSALTADTQWMPASGMTAQATKARLEVHKKGVTEEFRAEGNVAARAVFTLDIPVPPHLSQITALQLEILPMDEQTALMTPEWGALIQNIKLERLEPSGKRVPIALAELLTDEPHPFFDPNGSLKGASRGWGAYTKINRRRQAVIIPSQPIPMSPGSKLRLTLQHSGYSAGGSFPLITRRGRISMSGDPRWSRFLQDSSVQQDKAQLLTARKKLRSIPSTSLPDMRDLPQNLRRATHVFVRGNWLNKGDLIHQPGTPRIFAPLSGTPDRLAMARWLVSPENPLTARVAVNRFWLELFGTGIVPTPEDFGSAGEKPTHPELLDTLAVRFRTGMKWSIKSLLRELVTSATYRQDATVTPEMAERDLDNRLLARGPRQRLTGEMTRDQGLRVSGLMTDLQGGKPAYPPLPKSVWTPFVQDPWETPAEGDPARYRRSVYTYWKRSIPYPVFTTFDAPPRDLCSKRRIVSNTPLQALAVLNDPAFHEFARGLARRMAMDFPGNTDARLSLGYRAATSQQITPERLGELRRLFNQMRLQYAATSGQSKPAGQSADVAAYTVIASVLLNLDEALIR